MMQRILLLLALFAVPTVAPAAPLQAGMNEAGKVPFARGLLGNLTDIGEMVTWSAIFAAAVLLAIAALRIASARASLREQQKQRARDTLRYAVAYALLGICMTGAGIFVLMSR